jgi:integral membrane protein
MSSAVLRQLRFVGLLEGISFLLLLGVAMPLKYLADMPRAVSIVGMVHGLLFVLFVAAAVHAALTVRWPLSRTLMVMGAAVLPAGPFVIDGWLRRQQEALREPGLRS